LIIQYTGPIISEADADTYPEEKQVFFFGHADEEKVIDGRYDVIHTQGYPKPNLSPQKRGLEYGQVDKPQVWAE